MADGPFALWVTRAGAVMGLGRVRPARHDGLERRSDRPELPHLEVEDASELLLRGGAAQPASDPLQGLVGDAGGFGQAVQFARVLDLAQLLDQSDGGHQVNL